LSVVDITQSTAPPERPEGALEPYVRALRARWPLVLLVMLAAVGGSVAWLSLRKPDYKATAHLLVAPLPAEDPTFQGIDVLRADPNESTRTVQTAAALVESPAAAGLAARRLGPGWTLAAVESAVDVQPLGQSNLLAVTALVENGPQAARVANQYARAALDVRRQRIQRQADTILSSLVAQQQSGAAAGQAGAALADRIARLRAVRVSGDPTLSVTETAAAPTSPVGAPSWLVVALALIGGFALGTGAALVMEVLDRRIRDEEELRRLYPLPVLSYVPELSRRRRRALRSPLATPPEVREAFRTLEVQLARQGNPPRVITLTSGSSGDAKTTSAVTLAIALLGAGHRVILMDFDLRKPDVGRLLGVKPRRRLTSLLSPGTSLEDMLVESPRVPTLRVLPADEESGGVVLLEPLSQRLGELFKEARELADYVIVDTPPLGEVSDALRLLDFVDDVIVVARPGNTNRANLELMRDILGPGSRPAASSSSVTRPDGPRATTPTAWGCASRARGAGSRAALPRSS
jgi:Mrp family chromosome partitioning ATPase/capsular polysaccharide biosynthesis protein